MTDPRLIFERHRPNPGYCLVIRPVQRADFDQFWGRVARAYKRTFAWTDVGSFVSTGDIMEGVLQAIARSDVIIADVSLQRPNVFYELGIAHAMKGLEKVVIVTRKPGQEPTINDVPFDVAALRFLRYDADANIRKFLDPLKKMLFNSLEGTTWFHLPAGATHRSPLMAGDDGTYRYEVTASAITGDARLKNEAVDIQLTVHREPPDGSLPQRATTTLHFRDETKRMCAIPHLPWRLRSEGHDTNMGRHEAVICMVPDRG
jgi:hypothetical protein